MKLKYKILFIVPVLFLGDQISKLWIASHLSFGDSITVIPGLFDIVHVLNRGGAFGLFAQVDSVLREVFFYGVSSLAVLLIVIYYVTLTESQVAIYICLSLILSGALGNLCDRFVRGAVVDFLSFHWYDQVAQFDFFGNLIRFRLEWPAFNVADSAITLGVLGICFLTLQDSSKK